MNIQLAAFICAILLIIIGIVAIIFFDNLIKKILGLMFLSDGVNLALIAIGYVEGGSIPILGENETFANFAANAANALPFALVLTNIVIAVSIMAVCAGLTIKLYHRKKTLNSSEILEEGDE